MSRVCKKNRNYDNDNDKLQCFTKTFNSQKYKKISPGKYPMMLYVAVSIRWISIRFDADLMAAEAQTSDPFLSVQRSNRLDLGEDYVALRPDIYYIIYIETEQSYNILICNHQYMYIVYLSSD